MLEEQYRVAFSTDLRLGNEGAIRMAGLILFKPGLILLVRKLESRRDEVECAIYINVLAELHSFAKCVFTSQAAYIWIPITHFHSGRLLWMAAALEPLKDLIFRDIRIEPSEIGLVRALWELFPVRVAFDKLLEERHHVTGF